MLHVLFYCSCGLGPLWEEEDLNITKERGNGERQRPHVCSFLFVFLLSMKKSEVHKLSLKNKSTPAVFISHPF